MKRQFNTPWLYGAALAMLVAISGCAASRSEQYRLEGDTYLKVGEYDKAAASYKKAELASPKNPLAQVGLAKCALVARQTQEAENFLKKALELDPACADALEEYVRVYQAQNMKTEAAAMAEKMTALDPARGGILQASLFMEEGRNGEAAAVLEKLRDANPKSTPIRLTLASVYLSNQQADKAIPELTFVIDGADKDSTPAWMLLADAYQARNNIAEFKTRFEGVLAKKPGDEGLLLVQARLRIFEGLLDDAEKTAKELVEKKAQAGWARYVLGCAALARGDNLGASNLLAEAARQLPRELLVAQTLRRAQMAPGGAAKPVTPIPAAPIAADIPKDWQTLWMHADLPRLLQGADAFLAENQPNVIDTLTLAALFTNNMGLAEEWGQKLPAEAPVRQYLDVLKKQDPKAIMDFFDKWTEEDPFRKLLRENAFGFTLFKGGARSRASAIFMESLQQWPDQAISLYNMASMFQSAGMPEFSANALQGLIARYPDNQSAHILLFQVLKSANKPREARAAAEVAHTLFPDSVEIALNLSQAYIDTKDLSTAQLVLDKTLAIHPEDPNLKVSSGMLQIYQGAYEPARAALEALQTTPGGSGVRARIFLLLDLALLGQWEQAMQAAAANAPEKRDIVELFVVTAAMLNTGKAATDILPLWEHPEETGPAGGPLGAVILQALGKPYPKLVPEQVALAAAMSGKPALVAQFALATACQVASLHDAAIEQLLALEKTAGPNAFLATMMFGSLPNAIRTPDVAGTADALAQRYSAVPVAWLGLASVCKSLENKDGEQQALGKAVQAGPQNALAWAAYGSFMDEMGDTVKAMEAYRKILEILPDDPAANNNLAYGLLMTNGDPQEALRLARKANDVVKTNPYFLHTLGLAQMRAGDVNGAEVSIRTALELQPGNPTHMLDYGKLLIEKGQVDEGKQAIGMALRYAENLGLEFPRKVEAQTLIAEKKQV